MKQKMGLPDREDKYNWWGKECNQPRAADSVYCAEHQAKRKVSNQIKQKKIKENKKIADTMDRSDGMEGAIVVLNRAIEILSTKLSALLSARAILTGENLKENP